MKMIYQIFKTEVRLLFYSPIAWIIMMFFAVQSGIVFTNIFDDLLASQEMGRDIWGLSRSIFSVSVLKTAQDYLFLYMPILTMGLIGKEITSGSFKLLQSSPVKVREIILGKYLSMVFLALLLTTILGLEVIFSGITIDYLEYSSIFCGLLGFFLLACAYAAIGLFMSCLLVNQLLTALGSILVLALLSYISNFGQDNLFVREITYWLSVKSHTEGMRMGILYSEDVVYFTSIIASFISMSMLSLWFERNSVTIKKKVLCYSIVAISAVGIGILSYQPHLKMTHDFTFNEQNSIKPEFKQILNDIDGDLKITTYVNLLDRKSRRYFPEAIVYDRKSFDKYIRHKPSMEMEYVFYYNNPKFNNDSMLSAAARREAILNRTNFRRFKTRNEVKDIDSLLRSEGYSFFRVLENTRTGRKATVRTYNDMQGHAGEKEIAAAMKRISGKLPVVAYLNGHTSRSAEGNEDEGYRHFLKYKRNRSSLENLGFKVSNLSLKEDGDISNKLTALIIADPVESFTDWELNKIKNYIDNGGNLILLSEIGSAENANEIAKNFGIRFEQNTLHQKHENFPDDLLTIAVPENAKMVNDDFKYMTQYNDHVVTSGAISVSVTDKNHGFIKTPLLQTLKDNAWSKNVDGDIKKGSDVVAYALNRKVKDKEQRIFVMGDADFISNGQLKSSIRGIRAMNNSFVKNILYWFTSGELPLNEGRPLGNERSISYKQANMFAVRFVYIGLIPLCFLILGAILLMKRQNK